MFGVKVPKCFEEFKDLYFMEAIDMFQSIAAEEWGQEEKELVKNPKFFWTSLDDWYEFENATGLSLQIEGDLRFSVEFVFLGLDISFMDDDQSKNQFAEFVKEKICAVIGLQSEYGINHITDGDDFGWCSFSWSSQCCWWIFPSHKEILFLAVIFLA